jgi:drug/metabolite transporter (DMT)-like permease
MGSGRTGGVSPSRSTLWADLALLAVAGIWGAGFVAQRAAMEHMGPFTFNAARYAVGAVLIAPLLLRASTRRAMNKRTLLAGAALGVVMFAAAGLQQIGLVTTTAARAGFLTGLYVLVVPVLGLVAGQRLVAGHVLGAVAAAGGLWLLSGGPSGEIAGGGLSRGDLFVIGCSVMWAAHVVLISLFASRGDAFVLAATQFVVVAVLSGGVAALTETPTVDGVSGGLGPILYSGVLVIAVAFTLQIIAQKHAPATHAAVLMSLEAVFGAVFGVLLLSERLSPFEIAGGGLMFAGMLVSQLWPHKRTPAERAELRDPVR